MQFNWKKFFAGTCLSLTLLLPQAQAAEPKPEQSAANWQLIRNAMELSSQQKAFDSSLDTYISIQAPEGKKLRLVITAKGSNQLSNQKKRVSHSTGTYEVLLELPGHRSNTYSGSFEEYSEGKDEKYTSYVKDGEGWTSRVTELEPEFFKDLCQRAQRYAELVEGSADALLVGEKDGIAEIKLAPRPGAVLPDITELLKNKKSLDAWRQARPFLADITPENVEVHIFIDRKTGAMTGAVTSLGKWLQDELALLSARPEIGSLPMLKDIDLRNLDCTLTLKTQLNPVPQNLVIKIPKEVKKAAKRNK